MNDNLMTADEARALLAAHERAKDTGHSADVWGPFDRLATALRTVIARTAEVDELRTRLAAERCAS